MKSILFLLVLSALVLVYSTDPKGKAFLEENSKKDGVVVTKTGLQYKVLEAGPGTGPYPTTRDSVKVHYAGKLVDGTEFDSSYKRGTPIDFGVTQVIKGWTEALQLMKVGDKFEVYIPSELGYGARGAGGVIPPNAALIFTVELLEIPTAKQEL